MPDRNSVFKALLLSLCGFVYKLNATFAVLLSFSTFLKISGRAGLPYYYIGLSVASLGIGCFLFASRFGRLVTPRVSYFLNPLLAVLLTYVGLHYDSLDANSVLALYIAVSLYDVYFGIFFWNAANAILTVREMRRWVGLISGLTFSGGILLGYLFPVLFRLTSYSSCYLICAALFLTLPVFVAVLPANKEEAQAESANTDTANPNTIAIDTADSSTIDAAAASANAIKTDKENASKAATDATTARANTIEAGDAESTAGIKAVISAISQHPLSGMITWAMLLLAFARYSSSFLYSASLSLRFTSEQELAAFAGAFESSLRLLSLVAQSLLLPLLLKRFRPPVLLRFTPAVLVAGAMVMLIIPGFWALVVFQFVLMVTIRTFDQNILNLFFNLYEKTVRNRFRFFSDGIVFAGAVILTGILLARFDPTAEGSMLYWLLLLAGLVYWHVAGQAQKAYVQALQRNLHGRNPRHGTEYTGENDQILDVAAELQKIEALPPRHWPLALGRLARVNRDIAAQIITRLFGQPRADEELAVLIRIAGRNGNIDLGHVLTQFLGANNDARVIADAVEAVYKLMGPPAIQYLQPLLDSSHNRVRANAVLAVIRLTADEELLQTALRNLLAMARSELADFRASAAAVVGELPNPCFSAMLQQQLFDSDQRVRLAAIKSCEKWRNPDLIKVLGQVAAKFPEDAVVISRSIVSLQRGLLQRIELLATETGTMSQVQEIVNQNRSPEFIEVFLRLLLVRPGLKVCSLMETLATHKDCHCLKKVGACVGTEGINVTNFADPGESLQSGFAGEHEQKILLGLLHCLNNGEFESLAILAVKQKMATGVRSMIFAAGCSLYGINDPENHLFARLSSTDAAERDMALELIEAACSQSAANHLKSLL